VRAEISSGLRPALPTGDLSHVRRSDRTINGPTLSCWGGPESTLSEAALRQNFNSAALKLVHRAYDLDLAVLLEIRQHTALPTYGSYCVDDVRLRHRVNERIILAHPFARVRGRHDGGFDFFQKPSQMPQLGAVDGSFDGAAGCVAHHENEFCARYGAGEFETAEQVVVGDVRFSGGGVVACLHVTTVK
jgi:hypothetical protein